MTRQETTDWLHGSIRTYGPGDLISECLVAYGEWARAEVEFICKHLLPENGIFIDVGAFIGTHSIPFALHVGVGGKGISFEPNSPSFSLLTANLHEAGLQNVTAYNLAASQSSGLKFSFFSDSENLGHTALHQASEASTSANEDESHCFGRAVDDLHLEHVDLIKIDAEGMERSILSGCIELITRCKPNIFLELNSLEEHAFVFELAKTFSYSVHGVRTVAFNPSNHKCNPINDVLGDGAELGIVLTTQNLPRIGSSPEDLLIVQPLLDLDELGIFLLSKPQYRYKLLSDPLVELLGTTDHLSTTSTSLGTQALQDHSCIPNEESIPAIDCTSQLTDELSQSRAKAARLIEELNKAREDVRLAQHQTMISKSNANKTSAELLLAQAKIEELEHSCDQRLRELNEIRASRSWLLTSPYRKLATLFRGLTQ